MLQKEAFVKYSRQIMLDEVGVEGQLLLKNAKIVVVGAGGLGCPILSYLIAAGIGTIGIVDFDTIETSNLPRQLLYGIEDIGKSKAKTAREKLMIQHPDSTIKEFTVRLDKKNARDILRGFDLVVDACDDFETRYLINEVCEELELPIVYGAIQKFEGQVAVFNYQGSKKYIDLFPNRAGNEGVFNCEINGVLGVIPGLIGMFQANEVIKMVLKRPTSELLIDRILIYNFLNHQQTLLNY